MLLGWKFYGIFMGFLCAWVKWEMADWLSQIYLHSLVWFGLCFSSYFAQVTSSMSMHDLKVAWPDFSEITGVPSDITAKPKRYVSACQCVHSSCCALIWIRSDVTGQITFELCDLWHQSLTKFMLNRMREHTGWQVSTEGSLDVIKKGLCGNSD